MVPNMRPKFKIGEKIAVQTEWSKRYYVVA